MSSPLDRIAEVVAEAVPAAIAGAEAGTPTVLPRGADPFAGAERPLLLTATRWTAVSPGGVLLGGTAEATATVLGFTLPDRPEVAQEDAAQQRRATDASQGEDEGGDAPDAAAAEKKAEAGEETSGDGSADGEPGGAGDGGPDAAPPPARRWTDQAAEASKSPAAAASDALIRALATLAGLPHGAAATQAVLAESDAMVASAVGPLPDAIVIPVRRDGAEIRLVVVVAGIIGARVAAAALEVGSASGPGAGPVEDAPVDGPAEDEPAAVAADEAPHAQPARMALGAVPVDLSAEIGTTRLPLSSVLALREGAVVELAEAVDAPIALVAGTAPVAAGELELDDAGGLVLHVTSIPGRPDLSAGPALLADEPAVAVAPEGEVPSDAPVDPEQSGEGEPPSGD